MKKRLLLLRHARHATTDHHRFLGSTDIRLAEPGHLQTASIAPLLELYKPERCFCSPLRRCIDTIKPISNLQIEISHDLREIDFGHWEGLTFNQICMSNPAAVDRWADFDPAFSFPGGERLGRFIDRVHSAANTLESCAEKTVLAVTHAGVIRMLICHFLGLHPRQYLLFNIEFGSLAVLELFGGRGVLTALNQGAGEARR